VLKELQIRKDGVPLCGVERMADEWVQIICQHLVLNGGMVYKFCALRFGARRKADHRLCAHISTQKEHFRVCSRRGALPLFKAECFPKGLQTTFNN
jgi:hypothetical protein